MATTEKAIRILDSLQDLFAKEVIGTLPSQVRSFDANGNPVLTISADSTPATGEKVIVIVVKPYATGVATDVFGNTANAYCPHVIQFGTEANYAGTTDNVADILTPTELLPVISEIAKCGTYVEWHQTANGTVPTAAIIAAASAATIVKYKPLWGIQSAI